MDREVGDGKKKNVPNASCCVPHTRLLVNLPEFIIVYFMDLADYCIKLGKIVLSAYLKCGPS
jgi:hypothetical protein